MKVLMFIGPERFVPCTFPGIEPNRYLVSDRGRVFNLISGNYISSHIDKEKRLRCSLKTLEGNKKFFTHRLVAWEFCTGYSEERNIVNHKDGNSLNNFYFNLEWVTSMENTHHAYSKGLIPVGEKSHLAKYSENFIRKLCEQLEITTKAREIYNNLQNDVELSGVTLKTFKSLVKKVKNRQNWVHVSKDYNF